MKWYYNLKIAAKLLVGFFLVAVIAGVLGTVGVINIRNTDSKYTDLYEQYGIAQADIGQVAIYYQIARVNMREVILAGHGEDKSQYVEKIKECDEKMKASMTAFEKSIRTDQVRSEFDKLSDSINKFNPVRDKVIQLASADQDNEAIALMRSDAVPLANAVEESINKLMELKTTVGNQTSDDLSKSTANTVVMMIVIVAVAMVAAVALGIFISRIISNPVKKMVEAADKLAVGDINVNVEANTRDEIGSLMQSFSKMIQNIREQALAVEKTAAGDLTIDVKIKSDNDLLGKKLNEMIETNNEILTNINSASDQVAAGARQVSASSQMLAQGSTEQASSIEEITSSMTQVAAQTKQNAVNANQANELALSAKENAVQGNDQMQEMVKAMAEINDSSSNISKIIKVIDEIAFQTNILALNAAVEAARAGQHGKGFAVVAEEVRNLAARSANAAKETTEMIENSIKKVEAGTQIANSTAEALNKIVDGVAKAAVLVGDIASASNEQASGIAQINQAISQVAQVVQTNSATAEESASASEELSSQADLMKNAVSRFKLKKVKGSFSLEGGLSPDMIRLIEDIADKKKHQRHLDQLTGGLAEAAASKESPSKESPSKTKISLEDNNFGKY